MEVSASMFMYLFLRLAPFILICFFSISSIFNGDLKGIVYLVGLILAAGASILVGGILPSSWTESPSSVPGICDAVSIGSGIFSKIPLGQTILSFTLFYLYQTMKKNDEDNKDLNSRSRNWPTLYFFGFLLLADLFINTGILSNLKTYLNMSTAYCYNLPQSLLAFGTGMTFGIIWANMIYSTDTPELIYFPKYKNNEVCKKASKKTFRCKVFKNGERIK